MFDFLLAALIAAVVSAAPAPVVEAPAPTTTDAPAPVETVAPETVAPLLVTDPDDTIPDRVRPSHPVTTAPETDDCIPLESDPARGQRRWSFFDCTP